MIFGAISAITGAVGMVGSLFGARKARKSQDRAVDAQAAAARETAAANRYAADKQFDAAQLSIKAWKDHNAQVRADTAPWREAGTNALNLMTAGITSGEFKVSAPDLPDAPKAPTDLPAPVAAPVLPGFKAPEGAELPKWEGFDADDLKNDEGYQLRLEESLRALNAGAAAGSGVAGGANLKSLVRYGQRYASREFDKARDRAVGDYNIAKERANSVYGRAVGEHGMENTRILSQYNMDRTNWQDRKNNIMDLYNLKRTQWGDDRSNVVMAHNMRKDAVDSYFNKLASLSGAGQVATNNMSAAGGQAMQGITSATMTGASALGAGAIGAANAGMAGANARMAGANAAAANNNLAFGNFMDMLKTGVGMMGGGGGAPVHKPWVNPDTRTPPYLPMKTMPYTGSGYMAGG